jgi:hypothetical protein
MHQKRRGEKFLSYHFFSHIYHKSVNNFSFEQVKKIFLAKTVGIIVLFIQKFVSKLSKIWLWDLGFEIWGPGKTYSGSRIQGKEGIGSRIRNRTGFFHD